MPRRHAACARALAALGLALALAACVAPRGRGAPDGPGASVTAAAPDAPAKVVAPGTARVAVAPGAGPPPSATPAAAVAPALRVGTSGDYPPFSTREASGTLSGFDVEVARAYARDRGRDLELVAFAWPDLETRLLAGDFDVAMSGVTVRADRLARAPMTAPVARAAAVLVARAGAPPLAPGSRGEGLRIAVNRGGHLERLTRERLAGADIVPVEGNRLPFDGLASGEVDAVVTDTLELASWRGNRDPGNGAGEPSLAAVLACDRKAYWVRPDGGDLAADLDAWLAAREADGTLAGLRERFAIEADPAVRESGARPAPAGHPPTLPGRAAPCPDGGPADRLVDLIARRLTLMPLVATAKRAAGLPIDAPAREAAVEGAALAAARDEGLEPQAYLELVRAQIAAAKDVQRAVLAEPGPPTPPAASSGAAVAPGAQRASSPARKPVELDRDLRPAIDRIDAATRRELVRVAPLQVPTTRIVAALGASTGVPGIERRALERIATALVRCRAGR